MNTDPGAYTSVEQLNTYGRKKSYIIWTCPALQVNIRLGRRCLQPKNTLAYLLKRVCPKFGAKTFLSLFSLFLLPLRADSNPRPWDTETRVLPLCHHHWHLSQRYFKWCNVFEFNSKLINTFEFHQAFHTNISINEPRLMKLVPWLSFVNNFHLELIIFSPRFN